MTKKQIRITDGGIALPLGNNTFLMRGRLHSQGGIGIGNGSKNDIEVEDGEVVKFNKDNIQVLSDQPMLNGISPANALLAGGNFNKIFKAQQSINGNYGGSYGKDGLIKKLTGFFTGNNEKENANKENKKDAPIDWNEIKIKQAYTESGFNSKAVSKAPAYGLYQITPQTLKEFNDKTGNTYTIEDLYNDKINTEIRDWYMNDLYNREWNTKNNPSDSVRATKTIMAYNMGPTSLVNRLNELKAKGYDIYQSLDWTQDDSIPVESREYNDFILRNINNSIGRNQLAYETSKKKNSDKVEGIRNGFKNGGQINMKLKYKNKQDITDIVMNEILPHSTGKRMKFDMGGKYLLGNIGSNILNGLAQGITGIISGSQTTKFFRNLPDRVSSFVPVARQHISSDVRHILNPQLSEIKRGVSTLIDNAQKNTSSSKNYRQQVANATLKGIEESQKVYNSAAEIQTQRQIANANLQADYDKLDTINKINDIKEQNDYNMQKLVGEQNAKNQIAQSIGDSIGDITKNIGNSLMDYATMKHDLLKSNQTEDYNEFFEWNNSDMIKNGTLKVPKLTINKLNYKNRITKDYDKFVSIYGKDIVDGWLNQLK